ncbi:hypothetical protein N8940_02595, partial [Sphingomonadaceae bacterium]|nr:hypothetical protein [Sphingomonadaceae bacterium]
EGEGRKKHASFLALRIAGVFEKFAEEALNVVEEADLHDASHGQEGDTPNGLPKIGKFPTDYDGWKELPIGIVTNALDFSPSLRSSRESIRQCFSIVGHEEGTQKIEEQCLKHGNAALDIADSLRDTYDIPRRTLEWDWMTRLRESKERNIPFRRFYDDYRP